MPSGRSKMWGIKTESTMTRMNLKTPTHIRLKINHHHQNEPTVIYRMKRHTKLKRLMRKYCNRQSLELTDMVFLYDGSYVRGNDTPAELKMENGDEIDSMMVQIGG